MLSQESLTISRFERGNERTIRSHGMGSTVGAIGIAERYLDELTGTMETSRIPSGLSNGVSGAIGLIPSDAIAYLGFHSALCSVADGASLSKTILRLGRDIEHEAFAKAFESWDSVGFPKVVASIKRVYSGIKYRRQALRAIAQRKNFRWDRWKSKDHLSVGRWLLDALLTTPAFCLGSSDAPTVCLTEEALGVAEGVIEATVMRNPVRLPKTEPPEPWVSLRNSEGVPLVRSYSKASEVFLKKELRKGYLDYTMAALNAAQGVRWRINTFILNTIEACYERRILVAGLPPRDDLEFPHRPVGDSPNDKLLHRKKVAETAEANRGFRGSRVEVSLDLATARHLDGNAFWVPMNCDYRGRMYGVPRFNFQRQDYVRALFLFDEGEVLTADGLEWLEVHLANCGDFNRVSKASFASRVSWTKDNLESITKVANDPLGSLWWTKADEPFMFLAACRAYVDALDGKPCHLPVSFDGSCNGLQHLCAMTRAPEGDLVNLVPGDAPNDIYSTVARATDGLIREDRGVFRDMALAYGVTRSLVKRATMTFPYGSKKFGMANQLMDDLMKPLSLEVLEGKRSEHPFDEGGDGGYRASRYLAGKIHQAIESVVRHPAEAMRFIQAIARTMAHEGKPLFWHTPTGFPVLLRYPKFKKSQVSLTLHDKGLRIRFNPTLQEETHGIDKTRASNAAAPGFVHSLDASHLARVVTESANAGITSIALVHDSFGCLPNRATEFRKIILKEFARMYSGTDVLKGLLEEARSQLDTSGNRLPEGLTYGELDVTEVNSSNYAFA